MSEDKPINWTDQNAHFWSCFFFTLSTLGYGAHIVALWAISREYYQLRQQMIENSHESGREAAVTFTAVVRFMWSTGKFWNRDMKFNYSGIVASYLVIVPLHIWVL